MFRLYYNIFWGKESAHEHAPHEAPKSMTLPLVFLAVVTLFAGFIPFGKFVSSNGMEYIIHLDWAVAGTSIVVAVASIALATWFYKGSNPSTGSSGHHVQRVASRRLPAVLHGRVVPLHHETYHLQLRIPPHRLV